MTHLSLFSGIGGLDLAAEAAGFVTVGQCEWADYPTKVLEKHWPDVPRWRDIRTLTGEVFYARTGLRTVDVISGGFPCQPFSVAGKQEGKEDDRYLWPEMHRVIRELTPRWVIGENVPGILRIAASDVVSDLERERYDVAVFDFEAAAVGAPHRRERIAFVANRAEPRGRGLSVRSREQEQETSDFDWNGKNPQSALADVGGAGCEGQQQYGAFDAGRKAESYGPVGKRGDVCHAQSAEQHGEIPCAEQAGQRRPSNAGGGATKSRLGRVVDGLSHWMDEPDGIPRVATGVKDRTNRIKCLGNAVVPQQFYPFFKAIWEVEHEH